jgi:DNA-binding CsgD family transcriptional regulator
MGQRGASFPVTVTSDHLETLAAKVGERVWRELPALVFEFAQRFGLSAREAESAMLLAAGLCTKEIAKTVSLSSKSVDTYVLRAATKCGKHSRSALVSEILHFMQRR